MIKSPLTQARTLQHVAINKCNATCLSYFLIVEAQYLRPTSQRKKGLFGLRFAEIWAIFSMARQHGKRQTVHNRERGYKAVATRRRYKLPQACSQLPISSYHIAFPSITPSCKPLDRVIQP